MYNYKTILCNQWLCSKKCSYFYKCMFAHGVRELLHPGEHIQKKNQEHKINQEHKRKRYRTRSRAESSISSSSISSSSISLSSSPSVSIGSPLNPKAKEFISKDNKLDNNDYDNDYDNNYDNDYGNDYDSYWKIIHNMILVEGEQLRQRLITPMHRYQPMQYPFYHSSPPHPPFYSPHPPPPHPFYRPLPFYYLGPNAY